MNVPPLNTLSLPASAPFPPQAPPCSALPAHPHLGQCPCPCCRAVSSSRYHPAGGHDLLLKQTLDCKICVL